MKKLDFNTADFKWVENKMGRAQELFDQWFKENISEAPVVYGVPNQVWSHAEGVHPENRIFDTHTARLVMIEPIQAKECSVHDIQFIYSERDCVTVIQCKKCNKELRPKGGWETIDP